MKDFGTLPTPMETPANVKSASPPKSGAFPAPFFIKRFGDITIKDIPTVGGKENDSGNRENRFRRDSGKGEAKKMNTMKHHGFPKIFWALLIGLSLAATTPKTFAHCDGLDGPVVQAARQALDSGNVNLVLIWVQKRDEDEIRKAFSRTVAVRKLSNEARELADRSFFEALVRVHRAGEGAGFTGLKLAGRDLGPAIPAADKALRDGNVNDLKRLLVDAVGDGVSEHFAKAMSKKDFDKNNVEAGREFVKAYVEYIHCVEAIYQRATGPAHGHYPEEEETAHAHEK